MLGHIWTFGIMLILLVTVPTDRADDHRGGTTAVLCCVPKAEAAQAFRQKGLGNVLADFQGPIAKHVRWVTDHALHSRAILVKEGKRDQAVTRALSPGRQPVGVTKNKKGMADIIMSQLVTKLLGCWKG